MKRENYPKQVAIITGAPSGMGAVARTLETVIDWGLDVNLQGSVLRSQWR